MILNLNKLIEDLEGATGMINIDVTVWSDDIEKQLGTTGSRIYELGSHETLSERPECFGFDLVEVEGTFEYRYVGRC